MKHTAQVLVVEDEDSMRAGLEYALAREGYQVALARDGDEALRRIEAASFDLVLLDLMLPRRSGFEVLKRLREAGREVPVIVLTARGQEADKVRGFDLGADDYVTKPFGLAELLARVRARLRRREPEPEPLPERFSLGRTLVDLARLEVRCGKRVEPLTTKEAEMLRLLYRERGRPVARGRFLEEIWGDERFPTTRTVDQHVARLRKKLEADPAHPCHLRTVFGYGYRLDME